MYCTHTVYTLIGVISAMQLGDYSNNKAEGRTKVHVFDGSGFDFCPSRNFARDRGLYIGGG